MKAKSSKTKHKVSDEPEFTEPDFVNPGDAPRQEPIPPAASVDAAQDREIGSILKRLEKVESILGIRK